MVFLRFLFAGVSPKLFRNPVLLFSHERFAFFAQIRFCLRCQLPSTGLCKAMTELQGSAQVESSGTEDRAQKRASRERWLARVQSVPDHYRGLLQELDNPRELLDLSCRKWDSVARAYRQRVSVLTSGTPIWLAFNAEGRVDFENCMGGRSIKFPRKLEYGKDGRVQYQNPNQHARVQPRVLGRQALASS